MANRDIEKNVKALEHEKRVIETKAKKLDWQAKGVRRLLRDGPAHGQRVAVVGSARVGEAK